MKRLELKIPPVAAAVAVVAVMWGVQRLLGNLTLPFYGAQTLAAFFLTLAFVVGVAGVVAFRKQRTTVDPHSVHKASSLVTEGVFRFTRNPMYLALTIALLGVAAYLTNVATLIGLPLFVGFINRFQIEPEERVLQELFGQDYIDYMSRVPRWF